MVSFDVVSLFTNVPLNEVIDLACDYVYGNDDEKPEYERKHFRKLLLYATSGEFLYRDRLFKQVDGVAMGSPLGPTLANLFMAHLEERWVEQACSPVTYFRYVDDIFCIFDNDKAHHNDFLEFLNSQHPNLSFTCEIGPKSLPFLDVMVDVDSGALTLGVFRKTTYTGLVMNFFSCCPMAWKKGLIIVIL